MSEPLMYNENGSGQERVSRCCLENCPTHLEHLSQGRYWKVATFRYLFNTTALGFNPHLTVSEMQQSNRLELPLRTVRSTIMNCFSRKWNSV